MTSKVAEKNIEIGSQVSITGMNTKVLILFIELKAEVNKNIKEIFQDQVEISIPYFVPVFKKNGC